jgi:murein DD-endopeptidase MepM/ murein hydrolase activator NlpD
VKFAGNQGGFGKVIKIDHGNGYRTIYAHLSKMKVKRGQELQRGELIAISGNSGRSAGPHLHYEVHQYGAPQNPMEYFFSGYLK